MPGRYQGQRSRTGCLLLSFIIAVVSGLFPGFLCALLFMSNVDEFWDPYVLVIVVLLGVFAGGVLSGWVISPEVRHRRGRFFYIIGASPAFWIWAIVVFILLFWESPEVEAGQFVALLTACAVSAAGALAADWMLRRSQKKRDNMGRKHEPPAGSASEHPGGFPSDTDNP